MASIRLSAAVLLALVLATPASAEPQRRCMSRNEQRVAIAEGKAVPLATARRAVRQYQPGELVRARLCREGDRLIYVLTVLPRDGKVRRITVDATNGTVVGGL